MLDPDYLAAGDLLRLADADSGALSPRKPAFAADAGAPSCRGSR